MVGDHIWTIALLFITNAINHGRTSLMGPNQILFAQQGVALLLCQTLLQQ